VAQNYVIQFVIEHGRPHDRNLVLDRLRGNMLKMAQHKFASNVCEKALVCAEPEYRRALLLELVQPKPDGVTPIVDMMKDQFASRSYDIAKLEQLLSYQKITCCNVL
jgi:pumilio RNA-binding family